MSGDSPTTGRNPFSSNRFTRWWLASVVAGTGVGIQAVTVPLFIRDRVDLDARAAAIAAALIVQNLPGAVLALIGGTFADRIERRRILMTTYSVAALVSTAYVVLSGLDVGEIWPVFPLAAVVGAAGAFTNPARQSMLNQIVTREQMQNAVILGTMAFMATLQFVGPALGGLLTDLVSLTAAFAAETVFLLGGAILFSRIRTEVTPATGSSVLSDLKEGLLYVAATPKLYGLLILSTVPGILFIGPFAVTVPIIVPDIMHAGDKWVGLFWGCFGVGVLIGSTLLTWRPLPRRGLALCATNVIGGFVLMAYSQSETLPISVVILIVWGLTASVFMNYAVSLLQENAEPRMIGRVMSMYSLTFFASMPIGYAQAGFVTTKFGPQATLLSSGIAASALGLAVLLALKPVRELE